MVNKGFKNAGVGEIMTKMRRLSFTNTVGISIGRTNSAILTSNQLSIKDIIAAFKVVEKSKINNKYYELNISCPNLYGDISFYPPRKLNQLLTAIDRLKLKKPLFIKMPISQTNRQFLAMLKVIANHKVEGVIIGNLQTNRRHPSLNQDEVKKFKQGNFSGKPTFNRSNELIKLTYQRYRNKLIIIGCGGVFCGKDAYQKIKLGASLVQLVTGLIYAGPQLPAQINLELKKLLEKDGYTHLSQAIGTLHRTKDN